MKTKKRIPLSQLPQWKALQKHCTDIKHLHIKELFKQNPNRWNAFSQQFNGLLFDYSKHRITTQTIDLLVELAQARGLEKQMTRYQKDGGGSTKTAFNWTEKRAVVHTSLRLPFSSQTTASPTTIIQTVRKNMLRERKRFYAFATRIRNGTYKTTEGKKFRDIVHIGIGGSDLGPRLVMDALKNGEKSCQKNPLHHTSPRIHYVSNVDPTDLSRTLEGLHPQETLCIIVSKTFTTHETIMSGTTAKKWIEKGVSQKSLSTKHLVAVTSRPDRANQWGIDPDNVFALSDHVGGRTSVWSSVGLSVACGVGTNTFDAFLEGAYAIDNHFFQTPLKTNIPVLMGLLGIWYRNFFDMPSHLILPYSHGLKLLPAYLQQLDMESNGKSVDQYATTVSHATGPLIWGGVGTPCQHAFLQWLHQGTETVPSDFIVVKQPPTPTPTPTPNNMNPKLSAASVEQHHKTLVVAAIAQSQALAFGFTPKEALESLQKTPLSLEDKQYLSSYMVCPGNHPSTTLVIEELSPRLLGSLLALYEHKIFVQGLIWGINSFDQYGVECGKRITQNILTKYNKINTITNKVKPIKSLLDHCLRTKRS